MSILKKNNATTTKTKKGQTPAVTEEQITKFEEMLDSISKVSLDAASKLSKSIKRLIEKAKRDGKSGDDLDEIQEDFDEIDLEAIQKNLDGVADDLEDQLEEMEKSDAHIEPLEFKRSVRTFEKDIEVATKSVSKATEALEEIKARLDALLAGPVKEDTTEVGSAITGGGSYPMIYDEWIKAGKPQLKVDGKDVKLYFPMTNGKGTTMYYEVTNATDEETRSTAVLGYIEKGAFHPVTSDVATYIANVDSLKRPW